MMGVGVAQLHHGRRVYEYPLDAHACMTRNCLEEVIMGGLVSLFLMHSKPSVFSVAPANMQCIVDWLHILPQYMYGVRWAEECQRLRRLQQPIV